MRIGLIDYDETRWNETPGCGYLAEKDNCSGGGQTNKELALSVGISQSEVSTPIERCRVSKLVSNDKSLVNVLALRDFLIFGLQYVFPAQPGYIVRGMATAGKHSIKYRSMY